MPGRENEERNSKNNMLTEEEKNAGLEGKIIPINIEEQMKSAYIDYSMSVIVSRALPDVRDGLKPVHRRILYDMSAELNLYSDKPTRKSARIVGDVLGKFHPHGDSSVYEAMVRMAQDWSMRYPLVDGQGNFGSMDGDSPAAMRYTEARMQKITDEVMADIDKDTIDWTLNFDDTIPEPTVLPTKIPLLLVNGASGIAVGMATNMAPHNLGEVIDACCAFVDNPEIACEELLKYVKGPDFPTGGIVVNKDDLPAIYESGQGKIKLRGKVEVEELKGGKKQLVITEIPYTMIGAGIGKFLNDVAGLVETKKTTDITDISNQSSKEGIRIVLELKKGADVENLKNMLYKKTRLEDTFGVNMLAVADGRPETLGLKKIIEHHVDFRFELATRKYKTLLAKEQEKSEVQEGLIKACDVIDLIIEILRGSKSVKDAKACLVNGVTDNIKFKSSISKKMAVLLRFTERQAAAILEMRLYRLIGLEVQALIAEHEQTVKNIARYEDILNNYDSMAQVIVEELESFKEEYAKARRTVIENAEEAVFEEKKIEEQEVVFLMDRFGYARIVDVAVYERNKEAADSENKYIVHCMNTGKICIFTNSGKMHQVKVIDLPYGKFRDKGVPIDNVSNYSSSDEQIVSVYDSEQMRFAMLLFSTAQGMVKKVSGSEFQVAKRTILATKLQEEDSLVDVRVVNENKHVVLQTKNGYFLRFPATEVPIKKKAAVGVRGIRLQKKDELEKVYLFEEGTETKILYNEKEVSLNRLKTAKRDGAGTKARK